MKVRVLSFDLAEVDLEYQSRGLSEKNIRELMKLLERALFKMDELRRKESGFEKQVPMAFTESVK
jgi:hypothetical protein